MSHLAYLIHRSYVFEEYTWSHTPLPYTFTDFALTPARIPINAYIAGSIVGGPAPSPRAVNAEFWETVCTKERRFSISSHDAPRGGDHDAQYVMDWWVKRLSNETANCIVVENEPRIFDPLCVPFRHHPQKLDSSFFSQFVWE